MTYARCFCKLLIGLTSLGFVACAASPGHTEAPDTATSSERAMPFQSDMTPPSQIDGPSFSLPPKAIEHHVTGVFLARCIITENGVVEACKVLEGLPHGATEHLVEILHARRYTPIVFEGKRQRVLYTFRITFK